MVVALSEYTINLIRKVGGVGVRCILYEHKLRPSPNHSNRLSSLMSAGLAIHNGELCTSSDKLRHEFSVPWALVSISKVMLKNCVLRILQCSLLQCSSPSLRSSVPLLADQYFYCPQPLVDAVLKCF